MKEPLISIIIPVFNVENYLEQCLDSCLGQTYTNSEVIAVNDGSTDGSANILRRYESESFISLITQGNRGLNAARKAGIEASEGDYFTIVDGDDFLEPDALEKLYAILVREKADMVLGSFNMILAQDYSHFGQRVFQNQVFDGDAYMRKALTDGPNTVCMKLYRRSRIPEETEYPDIVAGQDFPLTLQWALHCRKACYSDEIVYNYVVNRRDSSMGGNREARVEGAFQSGYYAFDYLSRHNFLEAYRYEIANGFAARLYSYLSDRRNQFSHNRKKLTEINKFLFQHRKQIASLQLKVLVLLLKYSSRAASDFVILAQKLKPTLNPYTS